ncbi:hypothetical protein ACFPRL_19560 [Pseudoclavibacter helvolus]
MHFPCCSTRPSRCCCSAGQEPCRAATPPSWSWPPGRCSGTSSSASS